MRDFEDLTVGMILDFIITYNNESVTDNDDEGNETRLATQADFDRW